MGRDRGRGRDKEKKTGVRQTESIFSSEPHESVSKETHDIHVSQVKMRRTSLCHVVHEEPVALGG